MSKLLWSAIVSETINKIAYDKVHSVLYIMFKDGTCREYKGAPAPVFENLATATHADTYFEEFIKNKYTSATIEADSVIIEDSIIKNIILGDE